MTGPADWQLPLGVSRAVWDYAHDSTIPETYDASLADTPLLQADLEFVLRHLQRPSRVIDLGCGTGRVAIPIAAAGHDVVGIDLSAPMLNLAKRKARDVGANPSFICDNIVELPAIPDQSFDAAICLFSTLGMIAGTEARRRTTATAFRVLKPGGLFLLHVHNLGHHWTTRAGRKLLMVDYGKRLLRRANAGDFPQPSGWTMHLFTKGEITELLRTAGFASVEIRPIAIHGTRAPWYACFAAYGLLIAVRRPCILNHSHP